MLNLNFQNGQAPALNARNMNAIVESINTMQTQLANPFTFKGSVPAVSNLPSSGNTVNDTYYVTAATCLYTWDGDSWEVSSLSESDYLSIIQQVLNNIAAEYDSTSTYAVGDYCIYNERLYRCITAITSPEAWTAGHWTAVDVTGEVSDLKSAVSDIENMSPVSVFNQTVSGTQMQAVTGLSFPAGAYDITVDSIVSSDTDRDICSVTFVSNGTTNATINLERGNNISGNVVFTANIDTINFYASSSWPAGSGDTFTFTGFKLSQDTALLAKLTSLDSEISHGLNDGTVSVNKAIVWQNGYINHSGVITSSSLSQFALVKMNKGETMEIGTANATITIIGSTTAESVSVGDTVSVIRVTRTDAFEKYIYTAANDINLVVSVKKANYTLTFYKNSDIIDSIIDGWINGRVVSNGSFRANGEFTESTNRIRTDLIPFRAYDKITIKNGALQHAVGMWEGNPSAATIRRNDSAFVSTDETIIPDYDGFIVIAFRKSDNSNISFDDFDGKILLYQTIGYRAFVVANNSGAYDLPQYYFTDNYLKNKSDRINALGKVGDDVFCFITDIHWERNARRSPDLIRYIAQKCSLFKVFNGGDVADASMLSAYKKYRSAIDAIYHVAGNHDYFSPSTGRDLYYCMDSANNNQIGNPFEHYWYVDNVQLKIRYIVLNSFTRANGSTTITAGYDETQRTWFRDVALNLPGIDWDVIVFTHILRTTTPSISGASDVETIIDTFNADASHTGKILCVFQGHTHWDAVYHTPGGVPVITTTCDKWDLSNESELAQEQPGRVLGTITEQAFDVVVLNRAAKTFTCVRIGALAQNNVDIYRTDPNFEWIGTLEERAVSYN